VVVCLTQKRRVLLPHLVLLCDATLLQRVGLVGPGIGLGCSWSSGSSRGSSTGRGVCSMMMASSTRGRGTSNQLARRLSTYGFAHDARGARGSREMHSKNEFERQNTDLASTGHRDSGPLFFGTKHMMHVQS
jgi:hypothetical protein